MPGGRGGQKGRGRGKLNMFRPGRWGGGWDGPGRGGRGITDGADCETRPGRAGEMPGRCGPMRVQTGQTGDKLAGL